ncbi:hypothetical protein [Sapientia aquatica]|uniref:Uncharacterized protein n=1 Tax=Sapientia aquatica TaxID=1549640 RepID=A0A4R5W3R3_9BURK|nr:hypothetical protein [Sapientia aquatica]TDK67232.1 hypothetical protein E2I14_05575 [Sapientia aquatica]
MNVIRPAYVKQFCIFSLSLATCFPAISFADGLSDLKAALTRAQSATPIKATVDVKTWSKTGEGKELEEINGNAAIQIEENPRGLQLQFNHDLLAKLSTEERAQERDPKTKTPTIAAAGELSSKEINHMTNAAAYILHKLEKATLKAERAEQWNGKPARVLSFDYSQDKISEKDRKYVKKFDGTFDIWISPEGIPLASRSRINVSGSAMIVISFASTNEETEVYSLVGDRLVTSRKENKSSGSGMGEKMESSSVKTLQIQG